MVEVVESNSRNHDDGQSCGEGEDDKGFSLPSHMECPYKLDCDTEGETFGTDIEGGDSLPFGPLQVYMLALHYQKLGA